MSVPSRFVVPTSMRLVRCVSHPETGVPEPDGSKLRPIEAGNLESAQLRTPSARWLPPDRPCPKFGSSSRRHLVGSRKGWIEVIPGVAPHRVGDRLRLVSAGIVEARRVDGEDIERCLERHVDR